MSFDSPYGDSGSLGRALVDQVDVGRPVHGRGRREDDAVDAGALHLLEQDGRRGHVLLVRVQRALNGDARVLVAGHVHDALDVTGSEDAGQQLAVEHGPRWKGTPSGTNDA